MSLHRRSGSVGHRHLQVRHVPRSGGAPVRGQFHLRDRVRNHLHRQLGAGRPGGRRDRDRSGRAERQHPAGTGPLDGRRPGDRHGDGVVRRHPADVESLNERPGVIHRLRTHRHLGPGIQGPFRGDVQRGHRPRQDGQRDPLLEVTLGLRIPRRGIGAGAHHPHHHRVLPGPPGRNLALPGHLEDVEAPGAHLEVPELAVEGEIEEFDLDLVAVLVQRRGLDLGRFTGGQGDLLGRNGQRGGPWPFLVLRQRACRNEKEDGQGGHLISEVRKTHHQATP